MIIIKTILVIIALPLFFTIYTLIGISMAERENQKK